MRKILLALGMAVAFPLAASGSWEIADEPLAAHGQYVKIPLHSGPPAEPLEVTFQPLYPGPCRVWVRYSNSLGITGALTFSWNNAPAETRELPASTHWTWVSLGEWDFAFGDHRFALVDATEEVCIDRIYITPRTQRVPLAGGPHLAGGPPLQNHGEWAAGYAWEDALIDSLPKADPDGDGLLNCVERFFGLHPLEPSPRPVSWLQDDMTGEMVLEFSRTHAARGMQSALQTSTDLLTWTSPGAPASATLLETATSAEIQLRVDPGEADAFYIRFHPDAPQ